MSTLISVSYNDNCNIFLEKLLQSRRPLNQDRLIVQIKCLEEREVAVKGSGLLIRIRSHKCVESHLIVPLIYTLNS